jgi:hypothetical protein
MWTETTRPQYERKGLRYSSDVTDAEWLVISPHLPQRSLTDLFLHRNPRAFAVL